MNKIAQFKIRGIKSRLILLFLGVFLLSNVVSYASGVSVQVSAFQDIMQKKVTIDVANKSLRFILLELQKQTGISFIVKEEKDVAAYNSMSLKVTDVSLKEALNKLLNGTNLIYSVVGESVIIRKRPAETAAKADLFQVSGVVKDAQGNPLPGVTILIKGTTTGVSTDEDGKYLIMLSDPKTMILSFSFIGMKKKEVPVKEAKVLNVTLEDESETLEDVIITGYQKLRKNELTGAAKSVNMDDIMKPHMYSVADMLQGQVAGMHVINPSSTPGVSPKIRIRGESSISGNREPLWVVDGRVLEEPVKVSSAELNSLDAVNFIGNAISFINPDDIERIDVLMDAAATAIYGVRAANGVIVITTKKGQPGAARVSYSTSISYQRRPDYEDMRLMNSKERTEVSEEMHERGLRYSQFTPSIIGYEAALKDLWERKITDAEFQQRVKNVKETNTDWYDLLMRNRINHRHTVAVSGGGSGMRYRFSLGYTNNGDAVRVVKNEQYTLSGSLSNTFSPKFDMSLSFNMGLNDSERPHTVNPLTYAFETSRVLPACNPDGSPYFYDYASSISAPTGQAPYDKIQYNIFNEYKYTGNEKFQQNYSATLDWNWKITPTFKVSGFYSYSTSGVDNDKWVEAKSAYAQNLRRIPWYTPLPKDNKNIFTYSTLPYGGIFWFERSQNRNYNARHNVTYAKTFAEKHNLSFYFGTEVSSSSYKGLKETKRGYYRDRGHKFVNADHAQWTKYASTVNGEVLSITDNVNNRFSAYATFAYTYDNRYILNANIRVEGSNAFGQDKSTRFLPVWSISGRWNLGKEKFIEALGFVDDFAFKASYGWQGNVNPDQVPFLIAKMGALDAKSDEFFSNVSKYPNDQLTWERTASSNLGVSFSMFKNFLNVDVDYFLRTGKKQVVSQKIDPTNGMEVVSINGGDVKNTGFSLTVNLNPIRKEDWSWNISFMTSKTKNEVVNAGERNDGWKNYLDGSLVKNGESLNTFYSYKFAGLSEEGLPTYRGMEYWSDEGYTVSTEEEFLSRGMVRSGRRVAPLSGGINTSIRYKMLSFSASFAINIGNKIRLNPMFGGMTQALPTPIRNMSSDFVDRWKKPGDEYRTTIPVLTNVTGVYSEYEAFRISESIWQMYDNADMRVVPGDFLKCNNMSLSYMFNEKSLKKIGLRSLNLSLSVAKPFMITSKKLKGRDPEQMDLSSGAMPQLRSYSFSLSTSF